MIVDLAEQPSDQRIETDLCVIGGGAAGLAIAWYFRSRSDRDVVVLESGGADFEPDVQDLYAGELTGQRYYDLDVDRLRMLGGSTNRWGNQVGPFEPIDFEARPWIPHSGWPIVRADLDPWYRQAVEYFGLGAYDFDDLEGWQRQDPSLEPVDLTGTPVFSKTWRVCTPAFFAGERHRVLFEQLAHLKLYLHASVTRISLSENGRAVQSVEATSLNGRRVTVHARRVVLAAGGIENARLLLANDDVMPAGIGNQHDLVGRFFMDHIAFWSGHLTPRADVRLDAYDDISPSTSGRFGRALCFYIDKAAQRANEIGVVRLKLDVEAGAYSRGAQSLSQAATGARARRLQLGARTHCRRVPRRPGRRDVALWPSRRSTALPMPDNGRALPEPGQPSDAHLGPRCARYASRPPALGRDGGRAANVAASPGGLRRCLRGRGGRTAEDGHRFLGGRLERACAA